MSKLRHLAIASDDPDAAAQFYIDTFDFWRMSEFTAAWGRGHVLTDGTISLSILKYHDDTAAGTERGATFAGLHHIGFEVDDVGLFAARVDAAGGIARRDVSDALGIATDAPIKENEGPDGVLFDLGGPTVWKIARPAAG